jgi:hypothetical protein
MPRTLFFNLRLSRKDSGNTHDDLFISRCMLRADVKILLELNNISH